MYFFVIVVGAGDGILLVSPRAEGAPLIVVAEPVARTQPYLGEVAEFFILVNFLGRKVAVIVDYGHVFGMLVV